MECRESGDVLTIDYDRLMEIYFQNPEFGYVERPLIGIEAPGLHLADLAALDRRTYDVLVVFRRFPPVKGTWLDITPLRRFLGPNYHPQATEKEIRAGLGFVPLMRWARPSRPEQMKSSPRPACSQFSTTTYSSSSRKNSSVGFS